eukprot:3404509-Rhodomonas_salina.1
MTGNNGRAGSVEALKRQGEEAARKQGLPGYHPTRPIRHVRTSVVRLVKMDDSVDNEVSQPLSPYAPDTGCPVLT